MKLPTLKEAGEWFVSGLAGDLRSIIISSLTTTAVLAGWGYFFADEPSHLSIFTNDQGYAQPLQTILAEGARQHDKVSFSFEPDALRSVYVCEFAQVQGISASQMMLSYISKYPSCFNVSQTDENAHRIWRNTRSGDLEERNGQYLCRCGS